MSKKYTTLIIGGGHAGVEAALAASRLGLSTLLITLNIDSIASMPCNPAIGGIAKGQIVRELDVLGGQMAKTTDASGIQFKILNASRGAAVQSPRAQCDRHLYSSLMSQIVQNQPNLDVIQAEVSKILVESAKIKGVITSTGETILSDIVIVTTGTFLNGKIFIGKKSFPGGRFNERSSTTLSSSLISDCGLTIKHFKTSTPPRINSNTINYSVLKEQPGDTPPIPFSHFTDINAWQKTKKQVSCWLTYTNQTSHNIVKDYLNESSLFISDSVGPRYCPSIEDKLVCYPDKTRHHIFIEPESLTSNEVYLNGLYTGVPEEAQRQLINSIAGLENAKIIRYGYAIEYDYCPPVQIKHTLETINIENLYLAGQINGTTGYEEAAAQGLIAGINSSLKFLQKEPLCLDRTNSYIAILTDDIVTKGVDEPYRMFTSRAEFRLAIRSDNTDLRLLEIGHKIGLISDNHFKSFNIYKNALEKMINKNIETIPSDDEMFPWTQKKLNDEFEIYTKYEGYIKMQTQMAEKMKKHSSRQIPEGFDFNMLGSLSGETKEKFNLIKPQTIGQASQIPGVSPSDIAILTIYLEKQKRTAKNAN